MPLMKLFSFFTFLIIFLLHPAYSTVFAQNPEINFLEKENTALDQNTGDSGTEEEEDKDKDKEIRDLDQQPKDQPVPEYIEGKPESQKLYIYESPSMKTLSHLYWAINFLDIENDTHIDNFLRINECDIFTNYKGHEFEWNDIRIATRDFIKKNKNDFPVRFELVQRIDLTDYDLKRKAFRLKQESKILSVRRFEMLAADNRNICNNRGQDIEGYPKTIILELSRPFSLTYVPVPEDIALAYIKKKDEAFDKRVSHLKTLRNIYDLRSAFLVMQVKIFTHRGIVRTLGNPSARVLASLEGYEVYGDLERKNLFYAKSYIKKTDERTVNANLQKEFKILYKKAENEGMLH